MSDGTAKKIKPGDRPAMEKLVSEYETPIRLFAARLVPGHALAEDIAQEAFLIAIRNIEEFDASRNFGAWIKGIVRKLAIREWQRLSRSKAGVEKYTQHVEILAEEAAAESYGEEHVTALRHCIGALPEKSSQLLQMVYELGLSHSAIADKVRSSLDSIKKAISRLRFKLKECMEKQLSQVGA